MTTTLLLRACTACPAYVLVPLWQAHLDSAKHQRKAAKPTGERDYMYTGTDGVPVVVRR